MNPDAPALLDLSRHAERIAVALLGPFNRRESRRGCLRWGHRGSFALKVEGEEAGLWSDFETSDSGNLWQLIREKKGLDPAEALDWLHDELGIGPGSEKRAKAVTNGATPATGTNGAAPGRIIATYPYRDEGGALLFEVVRFDPKAFRQRRPNGKGGSVWNVSGVRRVIYRLPETLAAIASGQAVYIAEGEKAVEALVTHGLTATCSPGGANKWRLEHTQALAGADVVILPDNDKAGRAHARLVADTLAGTARRVRILDFARHEPRLPPKGDPHDWFALGRTAEDIAWLLDSVEPEAAPAQPASGSDIVLDPSAPFDVALTYMRLHQTSEDVPTLHHHRGEFFEWAGPAYWPVNEAGLRARLYPFLAAARAAPKPEAIKPNIRLVSNVMDALRAAAHLEDRIAPPAWLSEPEPSFDANEIIACRNGLLHWPSGWLLPRTASFFNVNAVEFDYRPDAQPPDHWLAFLDQLWPDDFGSIETLQEVFGLALVDDASHQKVFLLVGPRRSGKGTIGRVLTKMVGIANVAAPTLHALGTEFGLQPLINKRVAIIGDARIGPKTDNAAVVERLLSISGEDMQTVNRKNTSFWTGQLRVRFLVITNELPRLADTSGALAGRFIILALTRSFYGMEDHQLGDKLLTELPGILNWSLDGLRRLRKRGFFVQPEASLEMVEELDILTSPMRAFLRERCELGPGYAVRVDDLYAQWVLWCGDQHRDHPGTKQSFGVALRTAFPEVKTSQPRTESGGRERWYEGLRLLAP